jgi:hypothetical protein
MASVSSRHVVRELCEALGLDPSHVREVTMTVGLDAAVVATVEHFVTAEQFDTIVKIVEHRYRLELIDTERDEERRRP